MQNIVEILPQNVAIALGWSLFHSIWQSVLLVVTFHFLNYYLKGNSLKYKIGISLIFMQLALSIITYNYIFEPLTITNSTGNNKEIITDFIISNSVVSNETSILSNLNSWFNANINLIVIFWFLGIALYVIRFIFNIYQIKQLKTNGLHEVEQEIKAIFEKLILSMNISHKVKLKESSNVNSPLLIGHLKPFILLPAGLSATLSISEIEAILAHELAHLKRHDYLINLGQSVIDILYFFNPALLYLSSKTRDLRENCCDDLASEICGSKLPIAKALVQLEQYRHDSKLAMAFGRNTSSLKKRIQNLLGILPEKNKSNNGILIVLLMCFITLFYLKIENGFAQNPPNKKTPKNEVVYKNKIVEKYYLEKSGPFIHLNDKNGKSLTIRQINGAVYLNNTKYSLPANDSLALIKHNIVIQKLEDEINIHSQKIQLLSQQMQQYTDKIQQHSGPSQKQAELLSKYGQEIGGLAQKQAKIETALVYLDEKKEAKKIKELNAQTNKIEQEIEDIENKMEQISNEIEVESSNIDEFTAPLDSLSDLIEAESKPIEALSEKIEEESKKMWALYPEEVKKAYGKMIIDVDHIQPPAPPKPPKAPQHYNTPRPPKPPKAPKYAPSNKNRYGAVEVPIPTAPLPPRGNLE